MVRRSPGEEQGFTLVELMVALLLLGIVLVALAPELYGTLKAGAATRERSEANGLAVAATEELRSIPYGEVGYATTPGSCGSTAPVVLATPGPVDALAGQAPTVAGGVTYTINRCLYWVSSSGNITNSSCSGGACAEAYKQSVVTVSWRTAGGSASTSQTSLIYPGGESSYSAAANEFGSSGGGTNPVVGYPSPPSGATASLYSGDSTGQSIEVDWVAPTSSPVAVGGYIVEYWPASAGPSTGCAPEPGCFILSPLLTSGTSYVAVGSPNTQYYFQVVSVATPEAGGAESPTTSNVATGTTKPTSAPGCQISNLAVSPTTATENSNGKFTGGLNGFSISVNASNCGTVTVAYTPSSTQLQATMSGTGTLQGSADTSSTAWTVGNHLFVVYVNGSEWLDPSTNDPATFQVDVCQNGNHGGC